MKTITIKIADLNAIYNALMTDDCSKSRAEYAAGIAKLERAAAKIDTTVYWLVFAKLAKKIGYGAIKMDGWWYPVTNGIVDRKCGGYQHNTAAAQIGAYSVKTGGEWQHITSL